MEEKKRMRRNVVLLGITSLFNDISSEMIVPILPMFVTALGGNPIVIGLLGGLRDSISSLLTTFSGYWSDRAGKRKSFVIAGYSLSSLCKLLLAFSQTWLYAVVVSSFERTGKGLRTPSRDAIIAESTPKRKGLSFGIHRALDTTGAILGIILSFIFLSVFHFSYQTIIIVASLIGIVSLLPLLGVHARPIKPSEQTIPLFITNLPKKLTHFIVVAGLFALSNFTYMFFLINVQKHFTGKLAYALPVFFYLIANIFYASGAIPLGMLTDKIDRRKVITCGYALFSLTTLGFVYAHSFIAFLVLFACYGLVKATVEGNQKAFVADLAVPEQKATSLGLFHTIIGLLTLIGNIIAGSLWHYVTPTATFIWGSSISGLAVLFFLFSRKIR